MMGGWGKVRISTFIETNINININQEVALASEAPYVVPRLTHRLWSGKLRSNSR
jgi:hypothetical protein